jgi:hypothetical protein
MKLALLILLTAAVYAQNETAVLTGRVVDPQGLGVPGAKVHVTARTMALLMVDLNAGSAAAIEGRVTPSREEEKGLGMAVSMARSTPTTGT